MKLAIVIHRYGDGVAGGSEAHARGLAAALRNAHDVEVLTTCARDYLSWRNEFEAGETTVDGVRVTRFPVRKTRDLARFAAVSDHVFNESHERDDEERWIVENGPYCPDLVAAVSARPDVDFFLCYSYRYFTGIKAALAAGRRAILVPTAEEDDAIRLSVFAELFRSVRGFLYLTPEEKELIEKAAGALAAPSRVIGSGLNAHRAGPEPRKLLGAPDSYVLYVGRIDRNKGVDALFRYFLWLLDEWPECPPLLLVGHPVLDIPTHPKVRHLGYVSEDEKSSLIEGASLVLMPSRYESLSMIVLEAWALGRPVLANAACAVLEGQCRRSNGGLYYRDYAEFRLMLRRLMEDSCLRADLGAHGEAYVTANYSWERAAAQTNDLLRELTSGAVS
ncbi:MAG: glycosyltransferase family 4 protein [Vicinamibacteria bacterium]|nr:glycosyltransferase family 4 protein [Vicinamibacteria bacterium]